MKKLILVRHSKTQDFALSDKKRNLTLEGKERAKKVALFLKGNLSTEPEKFISSSANRALQSAEIFLEVFGKNSSELIINEALYTFSFEDLKKVIFSLDDSCKYLILFGHNFAILNFINQFGDLSLSKFPPSSLAILSAEVESWQNFEKGKVEKAINSKDL